MNIIDNLTFTGNIAIEGMTDLTIISTNGATLMSDRTFSATSGGEDDGGFDPTQYRQSPVLRH